MNELNEDTLDAVASEDETRLQLYTVFVLVGIPLLVAYGAIDLVSGNHLLAGLIFAASTLLVGCRLLVQRFRHLGPAVYRANGVVFGTLLLYMVAFSSGESSRILWMYLFPLTALFLVGKREGLVWTGALLALALALLWTAPPWTDIYPYSTGFKLRFITTYLVVCSFAFWYEHFRSKYRTDAEARHGRLKREQIRLVHEIAQRRRLEEELKHLANTDFLTGALNRRHLWEVAATEMERHQRYSYSLSIMLIDIDHFKRINDNFGHPAGDEVIKTVVARCTAELRQSDIVGRIGGEEFMVLLVHTDLKHARDMAERLRLCMADTHVDTDRGSVTFTVSIGLTEVHADDRSVDDAVKRADAALYRAKRKGRDRVEAASASERPVSA